ncbi:hypothetical protein [Telmatospirillum sp.]|uniref:hypothetical protein n=1 Tax=Telmatospirillum sp. TaxID=2079197 RepID=UPI00283E0E91|nr:hypothetical protein [Telmatospirillum sp.]MDR3436008.1 hypothetical protein [Telmatospirillum sp.]
MTQSNDEDFVGSALRRQGIALSPERRPAVAETMARLIATGRIIEQRLDFSTDIHGFQTFLRSWRKES